MKIESPTATFQSLYAISDEQVRYELDERAAIHEFDGGLTRPKAEQRTVEEYLKQNAQADLL